MTKPQQREVDHQLNPEVNERVAPEEREMSGQIGSDFALNQRSYISNSSLISGSGSQEKSRN
jgi:hypothetical protein